MKASAPYSISCVLAATAAAAILVAPLAHAQTRITVPGTAPSPSFVHFGGLTESQYQQLNQEIGAGW